MTDSKTCEFVTEPHAKPVGRLDQSVADRMGGVDRMDAFDRKYILRRLESCGRACYRSWGDGTVEGASEFVKKLVKSGHLSVLEHVSVTMDISCSRACSHQLVRHRLASYSQESQRYCIYYGMQFYLPPNMDDDTKGLLKDFYAMLLGAYLGLLARDLKPQEARLILPNGAMTRIIVTANLRQWLHMIELRTSPAADEEIRTLFLDIQRQFREVLPEVFGEE